LSDPVVFAEIHARDGAALRRFYAELFGWAFRSYGDGMDYGMAQSGEGGTAWASAPRRRAARAR
jgi:predicted enzyme related to lactoylglutathione lyase